MRRYVCAGALAGRCRAGGNASGASTRRERPPRPLPRPRTAKKKLEDKRNELQDVEKRKQSLETDVQGLAAERERLNSRLVETAALIQKSEGQLTSIEARLGELEEQERILKGSLNQRHDQIAKLLSALQRMGRNPPPVLITQREDALQMVRSAMLLSAAFPELGTQAKALTARLTELVRVMTEIRTQRDQLRTETTRLNDARTRLAGLMEEKKVTLDQRQSELKRMRTAAADISRNVSDLNELITKLDQAVKDNTGLGAYDEQRKTAAAANSTPNSSPPAPPIAPNSPAALPADLEGAGEGRTAGRAAVRRRRTAKSSSSLRALRSAVRAVLSLKSPFPMQRAACRCRLRDARFWPLARRPSSAASRRALCSKPARAPKSRHRAMAGLFTLASSAAMANS